MALMGPNGAGKSTLLKTLYGMTTIKEGSISWQGKNIAGYKSRAILGEGISFVPQGRCNFPVMTVDENLQMAAYTLRDSQVKADRDYVYDLFPILKTRRTTLAGNMSGGEQQLLEVAMAVPKGRRSFWSTSRPSVCRPRRLVSSSTNSSGYMRQVRTILLVEQNTKGDGGRRACHHPSSRQGNLGWSADGNYPRRTRRTLPDREDAGRDGSDPLDLRIFQPHFSSTTSRTIS